MGLAISLAYATFESELLEISSHIAERINTVRIQELFRLPSFALEIF